MNNLYEEFKLPLYLNLVKALGELKYHYKIAGDNVYIMDMTVQIWIEVKEKNIYLNAAIVEDDKGIDTNSIQIDAMAYALPIDGWNPFKEDILNLINQITKGIQEKRKEYMDELQKNYRLVETLDTNKLVAKDGRYEIQSVDGKFSDITITANGKGYYMSSSFNVASFKKERLFELIDKFIDMIEEV